MHEILEGKFHVMHQDPKAIHEANRAIFLIIMSVLMTVPLGHLAYLFGVEIAGLFLGQ